MVASTLSAEALARLPEIYDAAMAPHRWTPALDAVAAVTGAKGVMLYAFGRDSCPYAANLSNGLYDGKDKIIADYAAQYLQHDFEGMDVVDHKPVFAPVREAEIWPDIAQLRTRGDFCFALRHFGIFRRMYFNLSAEEYLSAGVILQFDEAFETVPDRAIAAATGLVPHVAKAMEISRFFDPLRRRFDAILAVLDRVQVGLILASPGGEALLINRTARRTMEARGALATDRAHRLVARDADATARLTRAIADASGTAAGQGTDRGDEFVLSGADGHDILAIVSPLRDAEAEFERGYEGAMITLVDPSDESPVRVDALRPLYGLTDAETAIAALLVRGVTVEQIAGMRNATPNTVRAQIRTVYTKTGTAGRAQFMWKAIQVIPPVL